MHRHPQRLLLLVLVVLLEGCVTSSAAGGSATVSSTAMPAEDVVPVEGEAFEDPGYRSQASSTLGCEETLELRRWRNTVRAVGCGRYLFFFPADATGKVTFGTPHRIAGELPVPFHERMTRPEQISGPPVEFTPAAVAHHLDGTWRGYCVIGTDGSVRDCDGMQPLPDMGNALLENLEARRYRPATLDGHPVTILYLFVLKLHAPAQR